MVRVVELFELRAPPAALRSALYGARGRGASAALSAPLELEGMGSFGTGQWGATGERVRPLLGR